MSEYNANELLIIDVSMLVDERNGFSYLPWAVAWKKVLEIDSFATFEIEKNQDGIPCFGNPEFGYICYTSLTFKGFTRKMHLPVLNIDKVIKKPSMFDINTTVMRCLVKNIALFGLGLDIYIGEDVPPKQELASYDSVNRAETTISKDPLDSPGIEADKIEDVDGSSVPRKSVKRKIAPEKEEIKKVINKLDEDFKKSVNECKEYTAKKKKDILNNEKIGDVLKRAHVLGKHRF